jgi:hypothetical protein
VAGARLRVAAVTGLAALAAGCGGPAKESTIKLPPDERPVRIGGGAAYRIAAISPAVSRREPIARLRCASTHGGDYGVHLELYARRLVLPVPAGIGVAPPQRRQGAYVLGGSCSYAVRTFEPTGVIVVDSGPVPTLGALFAIWGQPLSAGALAGFRGRVLAFVGGQRWTGPPGRIPLRRHAEIVLEVDGSVLPHPAYHFPPGL